MKELGNVIKRVRERKDINQDDFADKLGMKRTTYASKEQKGKFTEKELQLIAELLGTTLENIYNEVPIVYPDALGLISEKVIMLEATQNVQLSMIEKIYAEIMKKDIRDVEVTTSKVLDLELSKLRDELRRESKR